MGLTNVKLLIKNPKNESINVEERFLVDSGASYTVLSEKVWKKLKLKPSWEQEFNLADGKIIKRQIGNAIVQYQGREGATPVILGKKGDSLLLGVLTLEALGLALNPLQRKIYQAKMTL